VQPPEEIERSDPLTVRPDQVPGRARAQRAKRRPDRREVPIDEERQRRITNERSEFHRSADVVGSASTPC
jgi:hypothetical protein